MEGQSRSWGKAQMEIALQSQGLREFRHEVPEGREEGGIRHVEGIDIE